MKFLDQSTRLFMFAAGLAIAMPAQAAGWLLASPDPRVAPGQAFSVIVVGLPGGAPPPERLDAQIELPDNGPRIAVELVAAAPAEAGQRRYVGQWPPEVIGVATLALRDAPSARMLVDAAAASRTPVATAQAAAVDPMAPMARQSASSAPAQPSALGFHEPMYFLVGGHDPRSARFQFSFRYRLFDDQGVVAESFPVARGLYFGFTQTSLWDLASDSKPFRDSSFRPSLFYRWMLSDPDDGGWVALSGGYEHESNGKSGVDSRSIDTLFLRAEARYYFDDGRTYFGVAPKLWTYLDKEDNPDIASYRGYGELGLRLGRDDGLMLTTLLRRGTDDKNGAQIDLSYPLRESVFSGVGAFLHLQYFTGYGETLIDYRASRSSQFRVGFSLVR
ncbi:MAG: phospholipase A [Thauera sp.]|nr:phospholipase A [Thauera sp.]